MTSSSLLPQVVDVAIGEDRDQHRDDKAKRSPPTGSVSMTSVGTGTAPPSPPPSLMLPPLLTQRGGRSRISRPMVMLSLLAAAVAVGCAARFGPLLRQRDGAVVEKTSPSRPPRTMGGGAEAKAKTVTENESTPVSTAGVRKAAPGDEGVDVESSPPPGYPWNDVLRSQSRSTETGFAGGNGTVGGRSGIVVDVGILLTRYDDLASPGGQRLDVSSDGRGHESIPYLIANGRLLCPPANLLDARTFDWFGYWYRDRIRPFQEMASEALRLGKELAGRNPRFEKLIGGDVVLPLILDFADYRGCRRGGVWGDDDKDGDGVWPRFTFAREAVAPASLGVDEGRRGGCGIPFAVPGYETWLRHKRTKLSPSDWDPVFQKQEERYPWRSKLPVAVWRGSTTGDEDDDDASSTGDANTTWRDLPRARLVKFGMDNPHLLDAGFTRVVQRSKDETKEIEGESRVVAKGMPFDDFMRYRVVVDIDGNSWSSRFGQLLCTNSVVLKVEPKYTEYFYSELTPWEHYVPVRADMSDLMSTIEYATSDANGGRMRGVVRNANDWCRSKMTRRRMALDMLWILVSYAELLDESIKIGGGGGRHGDDHNVDGGGGGKWRERWEEWTSEQRLRTSSPSTQIMVPVGESDSPMGGEWRNELPYVLVGSLFARIITTTTMTRRPLSFMRLVPLFLVALVLLSLILTMRGAWSSFPFRGGRSGTAGRSRHVHQN